MKRLDLDVLEMVIAVAETGSFARGAEVVHRSASALSMQIKALEEDLGKPLFVRSTRSVVITPEGQTLLDYGRRMLEMRAEAWASIVRPEMTGRVTIGIPDDYASTLLPRVLRKFAVAHPRVEIRVLGLPSSALVPLLNDNKLDLACLTKSKGVTGTFIRVEPMVWVGASTRPVWKERPLPVALFAPGNNARARAISALQRENIPYRMSYESPSLLGLISMVEAGLAVAPMARCSVPSHLLPLSHNDGLPPLDDLEVVLARSATSNRPPCDFLAEQILSELRG
ncbi:LysR substrate-binding domain-containing protein [Pandoraea anhela]|uniref:LysR family transcriptional regulator n=1 Tax=Pandoraea anhela TaxID=2508295 RepID=A0A5E4X1L7_9BURK|nr:LysR substrate-binding domain-containing protein [Pandoraea anhela]VVE30190.1 LysR family transcriptional regulator [Pandoraea anhela]